MPVRCASARRAGTRTRGHNLDFAVEGDAAGFTAGDGPTRFAFLNASRQDLRVIHVVAAVIRDGEEFLGCRRNHDRGGLWEFPGGKVEIGETSHAALIREIMEELSVSIFPGATLTTVDEATAGFRIEFIHAELRAKRPTTSTDHDELRWLEAGQLETIDWADADRRAVEFLVRIDNSETVIPPVRQEDTQRVNEINQVLRRATRKKYQRHSLE